MPLKEILTNISREKCPFSVTKSQDTIPLVVIVFWVLAVNLVVVNMVTVVLVTVVLLLLLFLMFLFFI